MSWTRDFTDRQVAPPNRAIDNDAPAGMRQEFVDLLFQLADSSHGGLDETRVYAIIGQSLGLRFAGNPMAGRRIKAGDFVTGADWVRVYDLIARFWPEMARLDLQFEYQQGVNRILAAYGVVWELDGGGHMRRVLPLPAQELVETAIRELADPRFTGARALFSAALDAFDARPRRNRDACANAYDAMEAVAKTVYGVPTATLGNVLDEVTRGNRINGHVLRVLRAIEAVRHNTFGHGTVEEFTLNSAETDFAFHLCVAGLLLLSKLAP